MRAACHFKSYTLFMRWVFAKSKCRICHLKIRGACYFESYTKRFCGKGISSKQMQDFLLEIRRACHFESYTVFMRWVFAASKCRISHIKIRGACHFESYTNTFHERSICSKQMQDLSLEMRGACHFESYTNTLMGWVFGKCGISHLRIRGAGHFESHINSFCGKSICSKQMQDLSLKIRRACHFESYTIFMRWVFAASKCRICHLK